MLQVNVARLHDDNREALALAWVAGREGGTAVRREAAQAASLIGHLNLTHPNSIQVIGAYEAGMVAGFVDKLLESHPAAVIVADGVAPPAALVESATRTRTPLFTSPLPAPRVIERLSRYLAKALAETVERGDPLLLRQVGVDPVDRMPGAMERAVEPLGVAPAPDEDQRRAELLVQERQDARLLVVRVDEIEPVGDPRRGAPGWRDVDAQRIGQEAPCQPLDRRRHRRREHERVALLRQLLEDGVDLGHEPHVEHVVGFVEHQLLDVVELHGAALEMVEEPARSRDDDVRPLGERVHLVLDVQAANERDGAQPVAGPEVVEERLGLERDLARRREDQPADRALTLRPDPLRERDRERRGLARAGFGEPHDVEPGDRLRNHRRLDRRRMRPAELLDRQPQLWRQAQIIEAAARFGNGVLRQRGGGHAYGHSMPDRGTVFPPAGPGVDPAVDLSPRGRAG